MPRPQRTPWASPARWRAAAVLLPAIDRHGWLDDYRAITTRTIRDRLARASDCAATDSVPGEPSGALTTATGPVSPTTEARPARAAPELDEVLTLLDGVADDADALNVRIQALLADERPSRRRT